MNRRAHLLISGRVQGVWYRASTKQEADALGISGWVRNLPDGRVEVLAEGDEIAIDALLSWCRTGPRGASVTDVVSTFSPCRDEFDEFRVVR